MLDINFSTKELEQLKQSIQGQENSDEPNLAGSYYKLGSNLKEEVTIVFRKKLQIVGYSLIQFNSSFTEIVLFEILIPFRRKGIGIDFLTQLEQFVKSKGTKKIILEPIFNSNNWWKANGYCDIDYQWQKSI